MHRAIRLVGVGAVLLLGLIAGAPRAIAQQHYPTYPPQSTTAPRGDVVGGSYLGCFKDTSDYDLNGHLERSGTNTPRYCIATCAARGFAYAGVQYGESCLCGNSYGRYGAADNCNYRCTGDASQVCGGYSANSVYSTGVAATPTTTPPGRVDCGPPDPTYEYNTNRYGGDYMRYAVKPTDCPQQCAQVCAADNRCQAWSFVRAGFPDAGCYLKDSQPRPTANPCCISGTFTRIVDRSPGGPGTGTGGPTGNWTGWFNRDDPGASADYEDLASIRGSVPCAPIGIECRVVAPDLRDWRQAGQRYSCSLQAAVPGGICVNAENEGRCLNYEVRYLCP